MKKYAIVFPGQGSQKVGMGADLIAAFPHAKTFFEEAKSVLERDLLSICIEGPNELLTKTENAQPAIFTISAILFEALKKSGVTISAFAGHSLGELTAYYASGSTTFKDTLTLIKERGQAMANAYPPDDSAMSAVMGLDLEKIQTILEPYKQDPVVAANLNCPGQIVISGKKGSVEKASLELKEAGAKLIPLNVSGAFHSPLMQKASDHLKNTVTSFSFQSIDTPIYLNRTASAEQNAEALKTNLPIQVISPVRWIESIQTISPKVDAFIECGPGKVLSGLIKKIAPESTIITINDLESLKNFEATLS